MSMHCLEHCRTCWTQHRTPGCRFCDGVHLVKLENCRNAMVRRLRLTPPKRLAEWTRLPDIPHECDERIGCPHLLGKVMFWCLYFECLYEQSYVSFCLKSLTLSGKEIQVVETLGFDVSVFVHELTSYSRPRHS